MPQVIELHEDKKVIDGERIEIKYAILDAADDSEAMVALQNAVPSTLEGLPASEYRLDELIRDEGTGSVNWYAYVVYSDDGQNLSTGERSLSVDTSGGTENIKVSIKTTIYGNKNGVKGGAINFNGEEVLGVDIFKPAYKFSETHTFDNSVVTSAYRINLYNATGTVNDDNFREFKAGEVLFTGVQMSKTESSKWTLTFNFEARPNEENIKIGDITVDKKKGWEYAWVAFKKEVAGGAKVIEQRPDRVHIEQVYRETDFSKLGIGIEIWDESTNFGLGFDE